MKLGIIGAMDVEVQTIQKKMTSIVVDIWTVAGMEFYEGELKGVPCVIVQCGVGKVNAAICTQILCSRFAVTHIINTGIAGSLCSQIDVGDLVLSYDALHHDFDCTAFGHPVCSIPGMPFGFPADDDLLLVALRAAKIVHQGRVWTGRIASGDQFVASEEMKRSIVNNTGALCVEMEGAAIAQTAYRNGVPFVIMRVISDKADDSAEVDYPTFESKAAELCAKVVIAFAGQLASQEVK